jgi:hypothetical protein
MLYASKGAHTLFTSQREIKGELLILFLKGMTAALAPFSYLVLKEFIIKTTIRNDIQFKEHHS